MTYAMLGGPRTVEDLERHAAERHVGSAVWPQVTPRPLVMGMTAVQPYLLNSIEPVGALLGVSVPDRLRAYADPAWRAEVESRLVSAAVPVRWESYTITESPNHPEVVGRSLAAVGAEQGRSPLDVLFDTAVDDRLATRFQMVVANADPTAVTSLLTAEGVTLGLSTRAPIWASFAMLRRRQIFSATGYASGGCCLWRRRCACSPACKPICSGWQIGATCGRASLPISPCSIRRPSPRARCVGLPTCREEATG